MSRNVDTVNHIFSDPIESTKLKFEESVGVPLNRITAYKNLTLLSLESNAIVQR
jgi:hypothetical protein